MSAKFVKKTILLNQSYVDKARKLFGVKTEKEAVNKALEAVAGEDKIVSVHKEIGGRGRIKEVFYTN